MFKCSFNALMEKPELVKEMPNLFHYRLSLIPKSSDPNSGFRPISNQESILTILNSLLLNKIIVGKPIHQHQYALQPQAYVKTIIRARNLHKNHHLLSIDIKGAFNRLPFEVIQRNLKRVKVPVNTIAIVYHEYVGNEVLNTEKLKQLLNCIRMSTIKLDMVYLYR
ncbi:Reverse_transcriptase/endonuclease [Hexamita inflata]|uniref:Putative n=1 Tax=Hexamita inflata TaxID=28002 RepID=A0ABP1KQ01_9EUKA